MYFQLWHARLVDHMRARVRSGELTERGLARLTGVSQPHLHNVLKGVRLLSAEMADQVVAELHLKALDLLSESELPGASMASSRCTEVPLLEGKLGPAHPFPERECPGQAHPFLRAELAGIVRPLAVRLADDRHQRRLFQAEDIALLAPLPENGRGAAGEGAGSYYAIDLNGSSLVRRVERRGSRLWLLPACEDAEAACIAVADRNILEVVRARVIWIGRYLERSLIADRPFEEAGGEDRPAGGER